MTCFICSSTETRLLTTHFPGYVEGTTFPIYACTNCSTHFVPAEKIDESLYETIYAEPDAEGYSRYFDYAQKVKQAADPMNFLSVQDPSYFPVEQYVKNKKNLTILEVGCSYGYLTYALLQLGHDVTGIDLSHTSIDFAKKHFGDYFFQGKIESFATTQLKKFDLIVATELIEHLPDPNEFIEQCKKLLTPNGVILFTTPNKDYFSQKAVYQTDLPPVHLTWLGKKSFENLAEHHTLTAEFFDFSSFLDPHHNILLHFLLTRKETLPTHILTHAGRPYPKKQISHSFLKNIIVKILWWYPIRGLCHRIKNLITSEYYILSVTLRSK